MSSGNRVAWREGQFLRPQHFQQADRFHEGRLDARIGGLRPYAWGLREIQIDDELATQGKLTLVKAKGTLPDGTTFSIPDDQPPPPPLEVPEDTRDATIYLTLSARQEGAQEFAEAESAGADVRYAVSEGEVIDTFSDDRTRESIELARPHLACGLTKDQTYGRILCGLVHVREMRGKQPMFDDRYIPPVLDVAASTVLANGLEDILGRCEQRAEELAMRAVEATDGGADTFGSFLLLQSLNRWIPRLTHMKSLPLLHPESLYVELASLGGEIATMIRSDRKAPVYPTYDHEDLRATFEPLFSSLRAMLSAMFDRSAVQLPLEAAGPGAWVSTINDRTLYQHGYFYLAVNASASGDEIQRMFPSVAKIGPVEKMNQIVDSALPGVPLRYTPTPPPQLRVLPGYVYFELDRGSPEWSDFAKSTALGLHVAGEWPQLKLELWSVKSSSR